MLAELQLAAIVCLILSYSATFPLASCPLVSFYPHRSSEIENCSTSESNV